MEEEIDTRRQGTPFHARRIYRLLSGGFGLFLASLGIYAMFFAGPSTVLQLMGGAVLLLLGVNLTLSAYQSKESWLSRIGPLP